MSVQSIDLVEGKSNLQTGLTKPQTYINPIFDIDFPDPAILKTDHGFYLFGTQSVENVNHNIQVAYSRDLIKWQLLKEGALITKPIWSDRSTDFWAPHVVKVGNQYRMYYSSEPYHNYGHCIGMAVSKHPFTFVDVGISLLEGPSFTTIDPFYFVDPKSGQQLLYWGSCFQPIKVQALNDNGHSFKEGSTPQPLIYPDKERRYLSLVEGIYVIYKKELDEYFFFISGDNTWQSHTYATVVFRSKTPYGPVELIPNEGVLVEASDNWWAPGQGSVFTDDGGQDWYIYHAVDPNKPFIDGTNLQRRVPVMDRITYENGYPEISGRVPSRTPQCSPVVK